MTIIVIKFNYYTTVIRSAIDKFLRCPFIQTLGKIGRVQQIYHDNDLKVQSCYSVIHIHRVYTCFCCHHSFCLCQILLLCFYIFSCETLSIIQVCFAFNFRLMCLEQAGRITLYVFQK